MASNLIAARKSGSNRGLARWLVYALFTALLIACTKAGPEQRLDDYLTRLGNTLDTTIPSPTKPVIAKLPIPAQLRKPLPPGNLGALDFLALSGCEVQITIGKRNSSLGIFASDSQRLLLDLEYLQFAPACIDHMHSTGKHAIAETLEAAAALKRAQLPDRIFFATLGNIEFRDFWKKPPTLGTYPEQTSSAVLSALDAIARLTQRWLGEDYRADNLEFEILLSEIAKGDGGALLLALTIQQAGLDAANAAIRAKMAEGPLCSDHYRSDAADILPNVVHKYFITGVQPWSANIGRRSYELLPPVQRLEKLLALALPNNYLAWQRERDQALTTLNAAPQQHVKVLKQLLAPCNGLPGQFKGVK
ncbi:MAG: DUF3080 family protein [Halioglobus sp.]